MARYHHIFEHLIGKAKTTRPAAVAVVYPLSEVALAGAVEAEQEGLIRPTLVGPEEAIRNFAQSAGIDVSALPIVDTADDLEAAAAGVALCRAGKADALMKGSLHTDHFMHAVMKDQTGLRTTRRASHVFVLDVPTYPRMLLISDAAINIYPDLEDKIDIVRNAIDLAHVLGIERPKVAILSAVETVTPKIRSTIDAAALCKMADRGQITGAVIDGRLPSTMRSI